MARKKRRLVHRRGNERSMGRAVAKGAALAALPAIAAPAVSRAVGAVSRGKDTVRQVKDAAETATRLKDAASSKGSTIGKISAVVSEVGHITGKPKAKPKLSHIIEQHTDVAVPRDVAYNQWTQFDSFQAIMKAPEAVDIDGRTESEWTAKIGPSRRSWHAEVVEQVPDERIAWRATKGLTMQGVVTIHELAEELTRIHVQMEYKPEGFTAHIGNVLRIQRRRVKRDLRLFKHFIELRGEATGSRRNRVARHQPPKPQYAGQQRPNSGGAKSGAGSSAAEVAG